MKLLYTHPNSMIVENIKNIVEHAGFKVTLQNQYAGGGIGELAPIDAWPELWLDNERHFDRATLVVEQATKINNSDWTCGKCGEGNAGSFEICWACNAPRLGE